MRPQTAPNYLAGYPTTLTDQINRLIQLGLLGERLLKKYPTPHNVRTDKALYEYVTALKNQYLRKADPLNKIAFDSKLHLTHNALGIHTTRSKVQGNKLKGKREIKVATVFKEMPDAFLRMIVVHELAHIKEHDHNKAFYQLCQHMEPDYHQLEFDVRVYLTYLSASGQPLW